jgi:hypothetical protein
MRSCLNCAANVWQGDGASAAPTNVEFEDFDDYAAYAASRMRNQASAQNAEATDGTTPRIPLDDVCEAVQVGPRCVCTLQFSPVLGDL